MSTNDVIMTWQGLWVYYKSSLCSPEQREFILNSFSLVDALEVAIPSVQLEILEYAPIEVKNLPGIRQVLAPEVKRKLGIGEVNVLSAEKKAELRALFSKR